jgi:hypothetical protein
MHGANFFQGGLLFISDDGSRRSAIGGLSSKGAYLGNSSKCISRRFVIPNPLRAWPLRALRLGEKPSFGAVLVATLEPESHRKGAKDTKGDSHASNSKRVIDSKSVPHRSGELSLTDGGFVFR